MGDVSYKKPRKILIDHDMKKKALMREAGVSATSMAKITRGENVQTAILVKICRTLNSDFADIMEIVPCQNDSNSSTDSEWI
ncbi:transcriptional regulator [Clostridia bacterium]|nr:transcriptional regulator [Clostridia bacterium]